MVDWVFVKTEETVLNLNMTEDCENVDVKEEDKLMITSNIETGFQLHNAINYQDTIVKSYKMAFLPV